MLVSGSNLFLFDWHVSEVLDDCLGELLPVSPSTYLINTISMTTIQLPNTMATILM